MRVLHCPVRPLPTFAVRFLRLLREERYDAVHSHVLLFSGLIAAIAERAGASVRVAHAHNSSDGHADTTPRKLYRALMRKMIRRHANLVLACSRQAAEAFDCPSPQMLLYGIDLTPFEVRGKCLKEGFGIARSAPVVGMVGRLTHQKNHAFLLEALAEGLRSGDDFHLVIIGSGELRGSIADAIARLGLEGRAHLLGLRDDVPALLQGLCDALVMPSRHEGLPLALLEAQAAGLPCLISDAVSTEAVAIPELVEALPLDLLAWAERLGALAVRTRLAPEDSLARMRAGGFGVEDSWPRLTALYEKVGGAAAKACAA